MGHTSIKADPGVGVMLGDEVAAEGSCVQRAPHSLRRRGASVSPASMSPISMSPDSTSPASTSPASNAESDAVARLQRETADPLPVSAGQWQGAQGEVENTGQASGPLQQGGQPSRDQATKDTGTQPTS